MPTELIYCHFDLIDRVKSLYIQVSMIWWTWFHCFLQILQYLETKNIDRAFFFSDGCSSQYKSKLPFLHLTELSSTTEIKIERHFFGSSHGKSLCDACGGVVKACVIRAVAAGKVNILIHPNIFSVTWTQLPETWCYTQW